MSLKLLICALIIIYCPTILAGQVLFSDNFDRSAIGNSWRIIDDIEPQSGPSNWFIENEVLKQTANIWSFADEARETKYHLGTHAVIEGQNWSDFSINALSLSKDNDGLGLIARYQDQGNYYRLLLMNDPRWAGVDENGNRIGQAIQRLQKFVDGEPTTLAENRVSNAYTEEWFSITLDVRGDSLVAWLNGQKILEAVDTTYHSGTAGLLSYANSDLAYDSVLVHADRVIYEEPERALRYLFQTVVDRAPYLQRTQSDAVEIAWRTEVAGVGKVLYGTDKDELNEQLQENEALQRHHLKLSGLRPNTRYWYQVWTDDRQILELASFHTAPTDEEEDLSFFLLGDSGVNNANQYRVSEQMWNEYLRDPVDFIIHVGDLHQGNGDGYDDVFFKPYEALLKELNVFPAIGNHDTYTLNAEPYLESFYLPNNNPAQSERYYSFRWGKAFFISLDTNIDYLPGSAQNAFLIDQLQSEARTSATWTFVYAHHPPYSEYWVNYEGEPNVREYLMPVFEQYQVDMVMNGHTHSYERGEKAHVHYIVSGGGGGNLDDYYMDHPHITVSEKKHHFTRIDVQGNRLNIKAIDQNGQVFDNANIGKRFATFIEEQREQLPQFKLSQNYPNPFNPSTTIKLSLDKAARVRIDLLDSLGKVIRTIQPDKHFSAGEHHIQMQAGSLPSGTYTYRLFLNGQLQSTKHMTFLK